MSSDPGSESFFCDLRAILRILCLSKYRYNKGDHSTEFLVSDGPLSKSRSPGSAKRTGGQQNVHWHRARSCRICCADTTHGEHVVRNRRNGSNYICFRCDVVVRTDAPSLLYPRTPGDAY